jgi:leucyl-tRNA---protein transferase
VLARLRFGGTVRGLRSTSAEVSKNVFANGTDDVGLSQMVKQLQHFVEEPRRCSYLPRERASLEHRVLLDVTPTELELLLERGWRRFGPDYFRPRCAACTACVPTRIVVDAFRPSKSQRRAERACAGLDCDVGVPIVDDERLALYHAWHAQRESARGWDEAELTEEIYRIQFAMPHPCARELTYREPTTGRIVGVGLCDETPNAWSAIYFFYDPAYAKRSIGVSNIVRQVALARARGRSHVYLGYRVAGCPSLAYKAAYKEQEHLTGAPGFTELPEWIPEP